MQQPKVVFVVVNKAPPPGLFTTATELVAQMSKLTPSTPPEAVTTNALATEVLPALT